MVKIPGYFGVSVQKMRLPIVLGGDSILATSLSGFDHAVQHLAAFFHVRNFAAAEHDRDRRPCLCAARNSLAWFTFTSRSCSPSSAAARISLIFAWCVWFLCCRFFCWYLNLPKSMMRQTGGRSLGATSTRSRSASRARVNRLFGRDDSELGAVRRNDPDGRDADLFVDAL